MSPKFCHNHQPLWICSLRIDVEDLGTDKYYSVAEEIGRRVSSAAASPTATQTLGLVACGTGVGISIFANKFPSVFAATCLSPGDALNARSINNSNVLNARSISNSNPQSILPVPDLVGVGPSSVGVSHGLTIVASSIGVTASRWSVLDEVVFVSLSLSSSRQGRGRSESVVVMPITV
ncbi:hypothetical protein RJ640_018456 [Escallonia rubra]|uniref:Uncharacterized protein n=1 Tax=Escallonia rubra TaxID=112253 RepID=A0AA88QZM6_9ASTE|nr:hypothetical protein RJ640_018456 [Escallonia rubra]